MTSSPTFVLLYGAGTGPWIWDRVRRELSAPAYALEVPARRSDAMPDAVAEAIVAELDRRDVGYSGLARGAARPECLP